ncbi:hypothetical protein NDR87_31070 [Nocardia sp. CDC159]|uniref:Uncharacterized protein n=1 Tax=Nocardia pulmonis TaxID=2951408 RepID=A0A9X2EC50_9NOCA|nr:MULTISPECIES: hypothetical protein [Nocardia]MCM6778007.1 hypothetical protein [Nocardia pulmonis]MCM6790822.1 hypothetical protein [Nocardia sp. CDC159]
MSTTADQEHIERIDGWEVRWRKRGRVLYVVSVTNPEGRRTDHGAPLGDVLDQLPRSVWHALRRRHTGVG